MSSKDRVETTATQSPVSRALGLVVDVLLLPVKLLGCIFVFGIEVVGRSGRPVPVGTTRYHEPALKPATAPQSPPPSDVACSDAAGGV